MKILLACEFYSPSVGGVQEVMRQVAEHLAARGHHVQVATTRLPERTSRTVNGVEIVEFDAGGNIVGGLRGDVDGYRRFVLAGDYDVFMVKAAQQWTFDALMPVLRDIRKPKVFVPCGFSGLYLPQFAEYFQKMPAALAAFDHLIFYASDYRDINFAREHGCSNLSLVPNGASEIEFAADPHPGFRARHGIPADAFLILTVGQLNGAKGHLELAQAVRAIRLRKRRVAAVLNGNPPPPPPPGYRPPPNAPAVPAPLPPLWERLPDIYRTLGLWAVITRGVLGILRRLERRVGLTWILTPRPRKEETVEQVVAEINATRNKQAMVVNLPREEVVAAFFAADLFVFASHIEYSPLVLYEAAAAGTPFLSVPAGNAAEIARNTGAGVICPVEPDPFGYVKVDPKMLAKAIAELAKDPAQREALGRTGREKWMERYTWERITDEYERIFRLVVDQSR